MTNKSNRKRSGTMYSHQKEDGSQKSKTIPAYTNNKNIIFQPNVKKSAEHTPDDFEIVDSNIDINNIENETTNNKKSWCSIS